MPMMRIQAQERTIKSFAFIIAISVSVIFSTAFSLSLTPERLSQVCLDGKINPNTAANSSLVRLPGIGVGRAAAIVDFRSDFNKNNDGQAAFRDLEDLRKVKGIGPKTAETISQWLKFD